MKSRAKRGRPTKARVDREQLIRTALRQFAREGYGHASIQRIADDCGISQTAVLYHFPSKFKLIEAMIGHVVEHNRGLVAARTGIDDDARTRLREHFHGNLDWAARFPDESQAILLLYYLAAHRREFHELYRRILEGARGRIAELLAAGKREGSVGADIDVIRTAQVLHDALLGGIVNFLTTAGGRAEIRALHANWQRLFATLL